MENSAKLELWIRRQAEMVENEARMKKMKEMREKEEKNMKNVMEEKRKSDANEAFKLWMKKKEIEKRISQKTNAVSKISNNSRKFKRANTHSHNKYFDIVIGPYTGAKEMKDIQRKINQESERISSASMDNNENNEMDNENDDGDQEAFNYTNEKEDDSRQELSSIKKDTPVNEYD